MIGQTIAHYQVLEKLGEGGMGVVYKARDAHLDRFVALKVLPSEKVADAERKRRFVQEAKAASALNHPNIIVVHDVAQDAGVDFIVMEYIEGSTLAGLISQKGLPLADALKYAAQIADALAKAHARGIVHRDLKPTNIMVTGDRVVKVLDFGLAKLTEPARSADETVTMRTREGMVVGTTAYMSPEQAEGREVDARSDIFSFGTVLYEMLTGRKAFQRASAISTLRAVVSEEPQPCPGDVPAELQRVITRCLRKDPGERFQHTADLKLAIEEAIRPSAAPCSIAVLPFANMSADKENEYFSDGLAEEIINALTQVPGLRVTARTSAFAFRGKEADIREIGARLNVEHILEGSVRKAGDRIRVTAQLVKASDGYHLWSDRYDRELTDVFEIQDSIAQAIVARLRAQLTRDRPLVRRHTENLEAYNLYLQGRYWLNQWTPDAMAEGKRRLEQAIALDPNFAMAYDSLAELYWYMGFFGVMAPKDAFSMGVWAVVRALEIDDGLAEAHAMLGQLRKELDYNWAEVDREMRRALELNRDSPTVRCRYALSILMPHGRLAEAVAEVEEALRTDPLSLFMRWWLGILLIIAREFDRSIEEAQKTIELDPRGHLAYFVLGMALCAKGLWHEAVTAFQKFSDLAGGAPLALGALGMSQAGAGNHAEARRLLETLHEMAKVIYVPPSCIAWIYLALGEIDSAFDWLERAVEMRDPLIIPIKTMSLFDPLRPHPRFQGLLRNMNLES